MDDLIDLEIEAVDKIITKIKNDPEPEDVKQAELDLWNKIKKAALGGRRTGLGITALGDTLAAMGFVYGSKTSIQMTESLYKSLALSAYRSTVTMAAERGAFPVFSHKLEEKHPFIQQILEADPDLVKDYKKHGRRNIALTTTAPAGSVSVLTQTTSGIEPAFMLFYKRRKKVNGDDPNVKVDFVDPLGDKWQEFMVYHHAFKKWMEVNHKTEEHVAASPYHGGTANEIDWVAKVDLQAAAQRWICHSISNTCVAGDTLIETDKGLLYADEIAENNNCPDLGSVTVQDLATKNHLGRDASVGLVTSQGIKQVYRVVTKSGNSIVTTADHKFILLNEVDDIEAWTPLFDINVGDRIKLS
jgi:ribonucleoside-diphosphate reductase alpha chain